MAGATDKMNGALNEALEEFYQAEAEAIEQIDELPDADPVADIFMVKRL